MIADLINHAKDAAGRVFLEPISSFVLAFWSGDTRFCLMMIKYLDNKTKLIVLTECERIYNQGVLFRMNGEVSRSKHFALNQLIQAYKIYLAAENRYFNIHHPQRPSEQIMHEFWLNIGKEQAKLPVHLLQELSSKQSFSTNFDTGITYEERLTQPCVERTVTFTLKSNAYVSLIIDDRVNPELGTSLTVFKALNSFDSDRDICCWDAPVEEETPSISSKARLIATHWRQDVESDYVAMITIKKQRFEQDLIQILDRLKSDEKAPNLYRYCFR